MTVSDQLLAGLTVYGLPLLFSVTLISSAGIPLPSTFMLIAAGSFIQLGDMNFGWVVVAASCGTVLGDQIGYWVTTPGDGTGLFGAENFFLFGPDKAAEEAAAVRDYIGQINELEKKTNHDVIAFVESVASRLGEEGRGARLHGVEDLGVAGPAQAFITLGAISGHILCDVLPRTPFHHTDAVDALLGGGVGSLVLGGAGAVEACALALGEARGRQRIRQVRFRHNSEPPPMV